MKLTTGVVFLALIAPTLCASAWKVDKFNQEVIKYSSDVNGVVTEFLNHTASWEVGNQDHCTISYYSMIEAVDSTSSPVPPSNGDGLCTQQPCDKTSQPSSIDCLTAFGDKLSQIL